MAEEEQKSASLLSTVVEEIATSPLNITLVFLIGFLIYKIVRNRESVPVKATAEAPMPKMKKRDFTVEDLKAYDGTQPDGRVLVAVNGNVYDVTKGKKFYGPGTYIYF